MKRVLKEKEENQAKRSRSSATESNALEVAVNDIKQQIDEFYHVFASDEIAAPMMQRFFGLSVDFGRSLRQMMMNKQLLKKYDKEDDSEGLFAVLPNELALRVFGFLAPREVLAVRTVSKRFNALATDSAVWQKFAAFMKLAPLPWKTKNDPIMRTTVSADMKDYVVTSKAKRRWCSGGTFHLAWNHGPQAVTSIKRHGNTLASASFDKTIRLWNVSKMEMGIVAPAGELRRAREPAHSDRVLCMDWQTDELLVSGGRDEKIRLWNPCTQMPIRVLFDPPDNHTSHTDNIWDVKCRGSIIASASADHTLKIWDIRLPDSSVLVGNVVAHQAGLSSVDVSVENELFTAGADAKIKKWDARNLSKPTDVMNNHQAAIFGMARCGDALVSVGDDDQMIMWNLKKRRAAACTIGTTNYTVAMDADRVIVGNDSGRFQQLLRATNGLSMVHDWRKFSLNTPPGQRFQHHQMTLRSIILEPYGMFTAGSGGVIKYWSMI